MASIITIASGKGGVGKSVLASNLALSMAREGQRVVLVDLDVGGASLHNLFGIFQPVPTLTDFLAYRVRSLSDIAQTIGWGTGVRLIPGARETLASANLSYAQQQRLTRQLHQIDTDLLILDCATGTGNQVLDFFLLGDHQIVVANPDPTSVIELYRFVKLAAIRKVISHTLVNQPYGVHASLMEQEFESLQEVLEASKAFNPGHQSKVDAVLREFQPLLVLNRTSPKAKMSIRYLQQVVEKFIGSELVALGEIPQNEAVEQSIRVFQPVVDLAPRSSAAKALCQTTHALLQRIQTQEPVLVS